MTAQIIRLESYRDLTPELAATHRRLARLQRAKDAALLSLHDDQAEEIERLALTPRADWNDVRRIGEELEWMRRAVQIGAMR